MWATELAVVLAMIAINAVFAAYEIALASVSVSRLQALVLEHHHGAVAALRMKQNMEGSLAVVQLGITLVGAIAAATGGAGAQEDLSPLIHSMGLSASFAEFLAIALIVLPLTGATIVVGELVPKLFALRNQEWVCLKLSRLMGWFAMSVWPAVWALESSATLVMNWSERRWKPAAHRDTRLESAELQDLRASASLARTARLIGAREESIILAAARLSSRRVGEIMLPAEHISMLRISDTLADCLVSAHLDMHTRFPVTERAGDPQGIVGYVNFKDIIAQMRLSPHDPTLHGILRSIHSVTWDMPISVGLEHLMRERTHIALVRDGANRVVGMVTLEDIIEELVGDIQDEYDLLPVHAVHAGTGWVVGGGISLPRLKELTGINLIADLPPGGARNLSGWVMGHVGHPILGGECVERGGLRVLVRKVRRKQVLEAQISNLPSPPPAASGST